MNKEQIKKRVEELHQTIFEDLKRTLADLITSSDLDESETKDKEDLSNKDAANDMQHEMEQHLIIAEQELMTIQNLTTHTLDLVEIGALVETDHQTFYISVPTKPFEFEGKTVVGISAHAPLYQVMHGKKTGDSFSFNHIDYKILSIQ